MDRKLVASWAAALAALATGVWLFVMFLSAPNAASDWLTLVKLGFAVGLAFAVAAIVRFALSPLTSPDAKPTSPADADAAIRSRIAPIVLAIGSAAIIVLALALILEFSSLSMQNKTLQDKIDVVLSGVFNSVLPVFATWVGTVIAFYFTNESYRAAAQSTRESFSAGQERLKATPVKAAMLPLARMVAYKLPQGGSLETIPLKDVDAKYAAQGANNDRVSRLAFLDADGKFVAVMHRSIWMELLAGNLRTNPQLLQENGAVGLLIAANVAAATPPRTYADFIKNTVAFVGVDQSLADAKTAMEAVKGAQDVMVTQSGAANAAVIGWIMNTDIARMSKA